MNAEKKARILEVLADIREDIRNDVAGREYMPLTGPNVATALGEICAQVDALAHIVTTLVADVVPS